MKAPRHHRRSGLIARILGAVLLLQVLIPASMTPARAVLAGADGTILPTAFCMLPPGHADNGRPDRHDRQMPDHCVLCRLPAGSCLGTGPVSAPALPLPARRPPDGPVAMAAPLETLRHLRPFAARAPPSFPGT